MRAKAQSLIEYALVVVAVIALVLVGIGLLSGALQDLINQAVGNVQNAF
jgi:Flp pilus assembly pilin Flp